ncbi:hypothetical protein [uncultured Paracoccus sp.]|uniref:hypothetical protein n=1 Tax=uncultured Paracoccus sp. TaxID=189685 RepID=UPI0025D909C7|nr:hypothetical protein [uncultured Paracoccus sp.]
MLHQTLQTTCAQALPQTSSRRAAVGDLIRWPLADGNAGVALIVDLETIAGRQILTVAQGVDDHGQPVRPGTLRVVRAAEVRQSGLDRPIRFYLEGRISIAVVHPALAGTDAPAVVGHLCDSALQRLHEHRARLHALRDIAASRRAERRSDRRSDPRTGWRAIPRTARKQTQEGRQ